jgi:GNAT superfamily N-acetyltransferase
MCLIETYSTVHIGKYSPYIFATQKDLKRRGLSSLLFNFAVEYAIRTVLETQEGLKLNMTHHPVVYADDVHVVGWNINHIKKNTGGLLDASKEVGLEENS